MPSLNRPLAGFDASEDAPALIAALASGGDARITLDPASGLNRYHSAPYPRDVLAYSSSTVSDISADAFAHLLEHWEARAGQPYASRIEALRARIRASYGIGDDVGIVFAPSGTDLEYVALALALGRGKGGIHNVLLGADEIGSGCIHSAHGRYFANETALTSGVAPGEEVEGIGAITLVDVPVRCPDGVARSSAAIVADMAREIAAARAAGRHSVVHCVHGSKTGLVLPALSDLDALLAEFGDAATFVVDACQARITSVAIAEYLARGVIVLMTGSKFVGAPPFNGWALLPHMFAKGAAPLPGGFARIFRRAEWPAGWPGAEQLPDSANPSLALRLEAALFEIERFQAIPMERIETMIAAFEAALCTRLMEPLGLSSVSPGSGNSGDSPIEMRTLATLDLSGLPGLASFDAAQAAHKALALDGIRLGQPVKCVRAEGGWGGTMRVGLSMPQLSRWHNLGTQALADELAQDMARIAAGLKAAAERQADRNSQLAGGIPAILPVEHGAGALPLEHCGDGPIGPMGNSSWRSSGRMNPDGLMTSRDATSFVPLRDDVGAVSAMSLADHAYRAAFAAIGWPWLLFSLWGGTQREKQRLLARVGLSEGSLPHLGSWKADVGFLHRIVDAVEELRPEVVVELGAGASTLVAAKALALHGGGQLFTYDQHREFVDATARWIAEEGATATLRWAPLSATSADWPGRWYALRDLPPRIDLLIIDGPPWVVHPLVRGAAEQLFDRLRPGGIILLDDAARPGERLVARRWRKNWPDIAFRRVPGSTKGTLVGRKAGQSTTAGTVPSAANDNRRAARWRRAAASLALFGAGWMANEVAGDIASPVQAAAIVEAARASHAANRARLAMTSLPENASIDGAEIAAATGLGVPPLPDGWQIRDVQLYPSDLGNSLNVSITTAAGEQVSLFAARADTPAGERPLLAEREGAAIAYWEEGPLAYALIGEMDANRLLAYAARIAENEG